MRDNGPPGGPFLSLTWPRREVKDAYDPEVDWNGPRRPDDPDIVVLYKMVYYPGDVGPLNIPLTPEEQRRRKVAARVKDLALRKQLLKSPGSKGITAREWREIRETFGNACAYCLKVKPLTRDHVIPLVRGGLDEYDNIVPACRNCNSSKGHRILPTWYAWKLAKDAKS